MSPDARYRIEHRVADMETLQHKTWKWAEYQGVYGPRFIMRDVLRVWRIWHDFSASRWV